MKNSRLTAMLLMAISLLFAALMVSTSYWTDSPENKQLSVMLLVAAWWVPFSLLAAKRSNCSC